MSSHDYLQNIQITAQNEVMGVDDEKYVFSLYLSAVIIINWVKYINIYRKLQQITNNKNETATTIPEAKENDNTYKLPKQIQSQDDSDRNDLSLSGSISFDKVKTKKVID